MKKRYKFGLIPLGVLIVLLVAGLLFADWHGQRVLEREIDAVVAHGGYRDFSSFALPSLPDEENAATLWIEARRLGWGDNGDAIDQQIEREHQALASPTFADPAFLERVVASRHSAVEKAWAAAALPEVRWPIDYTDPLAGIYENYVGEARAAGRLLAADARVAITLQDWPRAEKSLLAVLELADDVRLPPNLTNAMVSIALDSLVMTTMEAGDVVPERDLPLVTQRLVNRNYREMMQKALYGEIVFGLALADENDPEYSHFRRWPLRLWSHYDLAQFVRTMHEVSRLVERPYFEVHNRLSLIDESVGPPYRLSGMLLPASHAVVRMIGVVETMRDLMLFANTMLKVDDQLHEQNRLEMIDPPRDSLTSSRIRYERIGDDGLVLWSIEAESAEIAGYMRPGLVWQYKTQELPDVLSRYAQDFD